jgi:hypothetical protein
MHTERSVRLCRYALKLPILNKNLNDLVGCRTILQHHATISNKPAFKTHTHHM